MRRAFIVAAAGLTLAGCGSLPSMDFMKPAPQQLPLQLESVPPGAEAKTSLGPACRTPCAVSVPATPNFTVTYTLNGYLPQTATVQLIEPQRAAEDPETGTIAEPRFDPSPVYVELQPAPPPPRKRAPPKAAPKRAPAPAAQAEPPPPAAAPGSPVQSRFPPPTQSGFPPPR